MFVLNGSKSFLESSLLLWRSPRAYTIADGQHTEEIGAVQDRKYQKKKAAVEKFVRKSGGNADHSDILNSIDVDYDTLMSILSELRKEGKIS